MATTNYSSTTQINNMDEAIETFLISQGSAGALSDSDILSLFDAKVGEPLVGERLSTGEHLIKFKIKNSSELESFLISISSSKPDGLTLYRREGNSLIKQNFIDTWNNYGKLYDPSVKINLAKGKREVYLVKIVLKENRSMKLDVYASTLSAQLQKEIRYIKYYYVLVGAFLFCLIIMIYFCFTFRKKYYIYASISMFAKLVNLLMLWQVANRFYSDSSLQYIEKNIYYFTGLIGAVAGYEFVARLLNTKKNYRKFHIAIELIKWSIILVVSTYAFTNQKIGWLLPARNYLFFIMSNILMALLIYSNIQGDRSSLLLLLGRFPLWILHVFTFLEGITGTSISYLPTKLESVSHKSLHLLFFTCALITRARDMKAYNAIAKNAEMFLQSLRESKDLKELLSKIVLNVREFVPYDNALVFLRENDDLNLATLPPSRIDETDINSIKELVKKVDPSDFLVGEDIKSNPILAQHIDAELYTSMMVVPLRLKSDNLLGYVIFLSSKFGIYEDYEINFAIDISQKISIMVEHYRQLSLINLQQNQISLDESLRSFINTISHDIRSPMYAAQNAIKELKSEYKGENASIEEQINLVDRAIEDAMEEVEESASLVNERYERFSIDFIFNSMSHIKKMCEFEKIKFEEYSYFPKGTEFIGPKRNIRNAICSIIKGGVEILSMKDVNISREITISYEKMDKNLCVRVNFNGELSANAKDGPSAAAYESIMLSRAIIEKNGYNFYMKGSEDGGTSITITMGILSD